MKLTKTLEFLSELPLNNNRNWFNANKTKYTEAIEEFTIFTNKIIQGIGTIDTSIANHSAKDCMFRIYRDTRFSHDKTPYKTHFGAFITPGGKNMLNAGYYIHFDAAEAFLAAGIHTPPANILQQIRHSIDINSKEFENIVQNSDLVNRYKMTSESLRSAPKGFSNDHPMINYLKLKSHTISFYPEIDIFLDENNIKYIVNNLLIAKSYISFLNASIISN